MSAVICGFVVGLLIGGPMGFTAAAVIIVGHDDYGDSWEDQWSL